MMNKNRKRKMKKKKRRKDNKFFFFNEGIQKENLTYEIIKEIQKERKKLR